MQTEPFILFPFATLCRCRSLRWLGFFERLLSRGYSSRDNNKDSKFWEGGGWGKVWLMGVVTAVAAAEVMAIETRGLLAL